MSGSPQDRVRWMSFQNIDRETAPAFACMHIVDESIHPRNGARILRCTRPMVHSDGSILFATSSTLTRTTSTAATTAMAWQTPGRFAFNGHVPVLKNSYGSCTQDLPARALVNWDSGRFPDSPAMDRTLGPINGSWMLGHDYGPWSVITLDSTNAVDGRNPRTSLAWIGTSIRQFSYAGAKVGYSAERVVPPLGNMFPTDNGFNLDNLPWGGTAVSPLSDVITAPVSAYIRGVFSATVSAATSEPAGTEGYIQIGTVLSQGTGDSLPAAVGNYMAYGLRYHRAFSVSGVYEDPDHNAENVAFPFLIYMARGNELKFENQSAFAIETRNVIVTFSLLVI